MRLIATLIIVLIVVSSIASCAPAVNVPTMIETLPTALPSQISSTQLPTLTATPYQLVFPSITMSPQENENALLELLKTNGDCSGKCLGGVRPDEMTAQEAVNVMSQWGMITVNKNSQGKTFINLEQNQIHEQLNVYLSVGTWTKELETIDNVAIRIDGALDSNYVKEDVWLANQEAFRGFRMDNMLKAYGVPSYVGYDFSILMGPSPIPKKGERFEYAMSLQYEHINLHILLSGMAYYDGNTVFLCPSKEPHALYLEINPERPLKELQNVFPVTWQALTNTDLDAYYQKFTSGNAFDACVTTNLEQIQTLQPYFR
jgi:hypothetical protein